MVKDILLVLIFLKGLDDFFVQLESVCGPGNLEISLKIPEKKKERYYIIIITLSSNSA